MRELLPSLLGLAGDARAAGIGFTIDAEEADRLELSLDLVEALALAPELAGWDGLGLAVQAYQKRAPAVIDWLADLAGRARRRLMVRLVKGAYWDSEIKRAQERGLDSYPVFTRKIATDVCYLACARQMFAAGGAFYPQFATHNAHCRHPRTCGGADGRGANTRSFSGCTAWAGALVASKSARHVFTVPATRRSAATRICWPIGAPARKQRQHLVRQPHRRSARTGRRDRRRPDRQLAPRVKPHPRIPCRGSVPAGAANCRARPRRPAALGARGKLPGGAAGMACADRRRHRGRGKAGPSDRRREVGPRRARATGRGGARPRCAAPWDRTPAVRAAALSAPPISSSGACPPMALVIAKAAVMARCRARGLRFPALLRGPRPRRFRHARTAPRPDR